jgi:hypothetical protein
VGGGEGAPRPPQAVPDDVDYELGLAADTVLPQELAAGSTHRFAGGDYAVFLRWVDGAQGQPLEFVAGTASAPAELREACRALGLGWLPIKETQA